MESFILPNKLITTFYLPQHLEWLKWLKNSWSEYFVRSLASPTCKKYFISRKLKCKSKNATSYTRVMGTWFFKVRISLILNIDANYFTAEKLINNLKRMKSFTKWHFCLLTCLVISEKKMAKCRTGYFFSSYDVTNYLL